MLFIDFPPSLFVLIRKVRPEWRVNQPREFIKPRSNGRDDALQFLPSPTSSRFAYNISTIRFEFQSLPFSPCAARETHRFRRSRAAKVEPIRASSFLVIPPRRRRPRRFFVVTRRDVSKKGEGGKIRRSEGSSWLPRSLTM